MPDYLVVVFADEEDERTIDYIEPFTDETDAAQYCADQERFTGASLLSLAYEDDTPCYRVITECRR